MVLLAVRALLVSQVVLQLLQDAPQGLCTVVGRRLAAHQITPLIMQGVPLLPDAAPIPDSDDDSISKGDAHESGLPDCLWHGATMAIGKQKVNAAA